MAAPRWTQLYLAGSRWNRRGCTTDTHAVDANFAVIAIIADLLHGAQPTYLLHPDEECLRRLRISFVTSLRLCGCSAMIELPPLYSTEQAGFIVIWDTCPSEWDGREE